MGLVDQLHEAELNGAQWSDNGSRLCTPPSAGVAVLDVVMSERLRPEDYPDKEVLGAMLACLENKQVG